MEIETREEAGTLFEELIKAYAFGLRNIDVYFCNLILEVIVKLMQNYDARIDAKLVTIAYQMITGPCSLRYLLVMIFKTLGPEVDVSDDFWGTLPSLFLRDLSEAFTKDSRVEGTETRYAKLEELKTCLTVFLRLEPSRTVSQSDGYSSASGPGQEDMAAN